MGTIDEVYEVSRQILCMYHDLFYNEIYGGDLFSRKEKIGQIRSLVMREYNILTRMPIDQLFEYIGGKSSTIMLYSQQVVDRVNQKVRNLCSYVIDGTWISSDELGISRIPKGMYFSFSDVTASMINIEIAKKLHEKIYSIKVDNEGDYDFSICLRERLRRLKADLLYANSTSEMIALSYHNSILAMPNIEKSRVEEMIRKIAPNFSSDDFDKTLEGYARNIVRMIGSVEVVENTPDAVFDYLFYFTSAEVLVTTFLGQKMLGDMLSFCGEVSTPNNQASMNMVKQLIKVRLNNQE